MKPQLRRLMDWEQDVSREGDSPLMGGGGLFDDRVL